MAKAAEIKVGDRVKCVDASASFHRLTEGGLYTVEAAYDNSPTVIVNRSYHSIERFELVASGQGDEARGKRRRSSLANAWQNRDADAAGVRMYGEI